MKFWIGAASNIANMSVVLAQLYIDGKCYGVHSYIVPLRDPNTYESYPGVLIGMNGLDNGFVIFDNYRIPKDNQLNRLSGVD
jgi:acyl-CoA oxidase